MHAQPPVTTSSTPAHPSHTYTSSPPLLPPSAYTQYMAWVHCRRDGIPARLVLETDGKTEDICLWFQHSAVSSDSATDVATHVQQSGKRRRERARRKRRREERRRESEEGVSSPAASTYDVTVMTATVPSVSPQEALPLTDTPSPSLVNIPSARAHVLKARPLPIKRVKASLTASRASKRAAVLAKKRGTVMTARRSTSLPREADEDEATAMETLRDAE